MISDSQITENHGKVVHVNSLAGPMFTGLRRHVVRQEADQKYNWLFEQYSSTWRTISGLGVSVFSVCCDIVMVPIVGLVGFESGLVAGLGRFLGIVPVADDLTTT